MDGCQTVLTVRKDRASHRKALFCMVRATPEALGRCIPCWRVGLPHAVPVQERAMKALLVRAQLTTLLLLHSRLLQSNRSRTAFMSKRSPGILDVSRCNSRSSNHLGRSKATWGSRALLLPSVHSRSASLFIHTHI